MLNISDLDSVRAAVSQNVKLTPNEYRAYCMGWYARGTRDLALVDLALQQFELHEHQVRAERKRKRSA